jgi:hypothetical protein
MSKGRRASHAAQLEQHRSIYLVELARGSSFIASTLTPVTQRAAITEVMSEFSERYGTEHLSIFRELLAESLVKRRSPLAAQAVLEFESS